jgi:hypothetical protein
MKENVVGESKRHAVDIKAMDGCSIKFAYRPPYTLEDILAVSVTTRSVENTVKMKKITEINTMKEPTKVLLVQTEF